MSKDRATIGKYEIVQRIGTGGFGAVYEARDPFIKRTVAVKTCLVPDKEDQERFFREAELAGRLHHRNVTTVHDFGVHDGMPYLVEEFLSGDDLDLVIRREDPLGLARRVEILIGIAYGLEHAHNAGIVHRDIKPSNIRLLEDGTVKIMDFGIASSLHPEGKPAGAGTALGTSAYLAPERIRGHAADRRADIFSFGVLAYELLTYRKPFGGETVSDTLDCILKREPEPLARLAPEVPASLAAVVNRALEKDPGSRYATIGELRDDLIAVHRDLGRRALLVTAPRPVPASPDTFADPPASPSIRIARGSRRTLRTAAAAALVFVAIAGGVIVLWPARANDREDLSAVARRTEAPVPKASATAPPPGEREFEPAPDVAPKTLSAGAVVPVPEPAPKARPLIRISRGAESRRASSGVESEKAETSHSASGSPSGRHHAERYARAAEEPGLSRETRAHLHLRSAMAYYEAGDSRRAERSLELAFALSPELEVGAGSYGTGFARLAHKARSGAS